MRKLLTVVDMLEAIRERHELDSDGQLARLLKVKQQVVSSWRTGIRSPGDDHALKIAEALDISPLLVIAIAAGERARGTESEPVWRKVAEQAARGVLPTLAALALITGTFAPTPRAEAQEYILCPRGRRRRSGGRSAGIPELPQPA